MVAPIEFKLFAPYNNEAALIGVCFAAGKVGNVHFVNH